MRVYAEGAIRSPSLSPSAAYEHCLEGWERWCCASERWTRTRIRIVVYRPVTGAEEPRSSSSAQRLRPWPVDGTVSVRRRRVEKRPGSRASLANAAAVCHYYCPTASYTAASWLVHFGTSAVRALQCRLTRWENRGTAGRGAIISISRKLILSLQRKIDISRKKHLGLCY